jgi:hypothetical protein
MQVHTVESWQKLSTEEKLAVEKRTLFAHLNSFGLEPARVLLASVEVGAIDGSQYMNENDGCGCILGTLAKGRGDTTESIAYKLDSDQFFEDEGVEVVSHGVFDLEMDGSDWGDNGEAGYTAAEVLAVRLRPGDTPENNEQAKLIADWTREWIEANS